MPEVKRNTGDGYNEVQYIPQNSITDLERFKRTADWVMKHTIKDPKI